MKAIYILCLAILLNGCDSEDQSLLKNLNFSSDSVATCVTESAESRDYKTISDVQILWCNEAEGVFDQAALNELNIFTNLTHLYLGIGYSIIDFNGEAFPYLTTFRCDDCGIINVELSQNQELESFEIWGNKYLESLDLSSNTKLSTLNLSEVPILNLTLGQHDKLKEAYIHGDYFYESFLNLDFSKATALENLSLSHIGASHLDLSQNINLIFFQASGKYLENIDINGQQLSHLSLSNTPLTTFDTSNFSELESLILWGNNITNVNLDYNQKLTLVNLRGNPLSEDMIDYLESITWIERVVY